MTSLLQVSSSLSYVEFPLSLCSSHTFFTLLLSSGLFLDAFSFFSLLIFLPQPSMSLLQYGSGEKL